MDIYSPAILTNVQSQHHLQQIMVDNPALLIPQFFDGYVRSTSHWYPKHDMSENSNERHLIGGRGFTSFFETPLQPFASCIGYMPQCILFANGTVSSLY